MRKIYLDSCVAMYLVEEHPLYYPLVEDALAKCEGVVCYSPLTELECLVLPLRLKRADLVDKFNSFFAIGQRLAMPDEVYLEAARLRAESGIKTPDALHLAIARFHHCTEFWTNDCRLASVADELAVNVVGS